MKKIISILLLFTVCAFSLFAYQNVYRLSSDEVQTFFLLRKVSSSMTPDPTYPVSAEQLSNLVKSLDTSNFNDSYMKMYNDLIEELDHPQVIFQKNGAGIDQKVDLLGIQMYQTKEPDVFIPYHERIPMANLETDMYFGNNVFGRFAFDLIKEYNNLEKDMTTVKDIMSYSEGLPHTSMISLGYKNLNLTIGRDRLGAGNGYTGNLVLGENSLFDDFVKLSYVNDLMSYDLTYKRYLTKSYYDLYQSKNLYIHRFSASILENVNFSMSEGVLAAGNFPTFDGTGKVLSESFAFDYLNPFMFMHNHFKFYDGSVNNFFAVEVTAGLPNSWQIGGQFFLDQLLFPGERADSTGELAYIALINASRTMQLGNGILDYYFEGVYGNPYVYLKSSYSYGVGNENHFYKTRQEYKDAHAYEDVDLIADSILDLNGNPIVQNNQYLGYKYGGDIFSIATGAKYYLGKFNFDAKVQYIAKGIYGIRDGEKRLCEGREDYCDDYEKIENTIQHTLYAELGAHCTLAKGVEIMGKVAGVGNINYKHQASPLAFDLQYSIGVNVHVLDFFNIRKPL